MSSRSPQNTSRSSLTPDNLQALVEADKIELLQPANITFGNPEAFADRLMRNYDVSAIKAHALLLKDYHNKRGKIIASRLCDIGALERVNDTNYSHCLIGWDPNCLRSTSFVLMDLLPDTSAEGGRIKLGIERRAKDTYLHCREKARRDRIATDWFKYWRALESAALTANSAADIMDKGFTNMKEYNKSRMKY